MFESEHGHDPCFRFDDDVNIKHLVAVVNFLNSQSYMFEKDTP